MAIEGMGAALNTLKAIRGCEPIQYPSGRWGFVGRVPAVLAYVDADGNPPSAEAIHDIRQFGGVSMRIHKVKERTWATKEDALASLASLT